MDSVAQLLPWIGKLIYTHRLFRWLDQSLRAIMAKPRCSCNILYWKPSAFH